MLPKYFSFYENKISVKAQLKPLIKIKLLLNLVCILLLKRKKCQRPHNKRKKKSESVLFRT